MTQAASKHVLSGPLTGGKRGWPFAASMLDVAALGYEEAEYLIEGSATRYRQVPDTEWGRDGRWQVEPAEAAPFKTRLLVYRPSDPARFNGTVVVTWNNVTAGYELFGSDSRELFEGGFALVCASVQRVGLEGLPPIHQGLVHWDPERYGSLSIPSDDYAYDIYDQIGRAVGPSRDRACDPMAGLPVERVIGQGASQSAARLGTYINALAPSASTFDAFMLFIYFGGGAPIEVGDAVVDINAPSSEAATRARRTGRNLVREDLGKPVFIVNSELEAIACHGVRQPDTDTLRWWESAGTSHTSIQGLTARRRMAERDALVTPEPVQGANAIPMAPLFDAAYHHMQRWLTDGVLPPIQPRVHFAGHPPEVVRDQDGLATGGIRLPQVAVPLAQNSAIPLAQNAVAFLRGSSHPFPADELRQRYGDRESFLARFEQAAAAAVDAGVLLPRDVEPLVAEAAASWRDA